MNTLKSMIEEEFKNSGFHNDETTRKIFDYAMEKGYVLGMNKPLIQIKIIDSFLPDISTNTGFKDMICMKTKISAEKYQQLVDQFVIEQRAMNKVYVDQHEMFKHLHNWLLYQVKNNLHISKGGNSKPNAL